MQMINNQAIINIVSHTLVQHKPMQAGGDYSFPIQLPDCSIEISQS